MRLQKSRLLKKVSVCCNFKVMKRIINIVLTMAMLAVSFDLMAQQVKKEDDGKAKVSAPKVIHAYLGQSAYSSGTISKRDFDTYLKQGLSAKDSMDNSYKVKAFTFTYAERNLYEDSIGNLMILTDYLSEFCSGDTVTTAISNNIYYKTKPGDTAYFDNIKVALPDGKRINATPIKLILTK